MDQKRSINIDALKGIAIILMVLGHAIQCGSGEEYLKSFAFYDNPVYKLIYGFHMPLFMLISGYLFSHTIKKWGTSQLLLGQIKRLLVPIFSWSSVVFLTKVIFLRSVNPSIGSYIEHTLSTLWFLWALLFCSLIVIFVNKFFNDNIFVYLAIAVILVIFPDGYNFELYKYMYPYFVIAYLFEKIDIKTKREWLVWLLFSIYYVTLALSYDFDTYVYNSGVSVLGKDITAQLTIDIRRFLCGLFGGVAAILGMKMLPGIRWKSFFAIFGKNSLGIYIISGYIVNLLLVKLAKSASYNVWLILVETALILFVSLVASYIIRKIKILNILFLGGR